jgi:DNA-directed RNA polymerase subunit M/transcription elongation factor TFIIS
MSVEISQDLREKGVQCLTEILTIQKNIKILEKWVFTMSKGSEITYKDLICETCEKIESKNFPLGRILENMKTGKFSFESENFKENKDDLEEENNFIMNPFEVEEGVLECMKCGSKKTLSYSKQMRGGDEGTTVMATCVNCRNSWKVSN